MAMILALLGMAMLHTPVTGFAVYEVGQPITEEVMFEQQVMPLGTLVVILTENKTYEKNIVGYAGEAHEIQYQNETMYGYDSSLVFNVSDLGVELPPGEHTLVVQLRYDQDVLDQKEVQIKVTEQALQTPQQTTDQQQGQPQNQTTIGSPTKTSPTTVGDQPIEEEPQNTPRIAGHVSCGDTITANTILDGNVDNSSNGCRGNGIFIGASNIILDCNGFTIRGDNSSGVGTGVQSNAGTKTNITITNCSISGFSDGIILGNFINTNITNSNITTERIYAISIETTNGNITISGVIANSTSGIADTIYIQEHYTVVTNSTIIYNGSSASRAAVRIASDNNSFQNNTIISTTQGIGILFSSGDWSNFTNDAIITHDSDGLSITSSNGHKFIGVTVNATSTTAANDDAVSIAANDITFINSSINARGINRALYIASGSRNNFTRCNISSNGSTVDAASIDGNNHVFASSTITSVGGNAIDFNNADNVTVSDSVLSAISNEGITLITNANNNTFVNVTIESNSSVAASLSRANNNSFINVRFNTYSGTALLLEDVSSIGSNDNYFSGCTFNTTTGIAIDIDTSNNNTFFNITTNASSGRVLRSITGTNNYFEDWYIPNNFAIGLYSSSNISARNVTFRNVNGSVHFEQFNATTGSLFNTSLQNFNITFNQTYINSSSAPALNTTATIVLYNITYPNITIRYDPENDGTFTECPSTICTVDNFSSILDRAVFNVTGFSSYQTSEKIDCGLNITSTTQLRTNINTCSGDGINMAGNNIELDCNNYDIVGNSSNTSSIGINVDSRTNITIRNCNVTGFDRGLVMDTTITSSVFNSTFQSYNLDRGINLIDSKNNTFFNVTGRSNSSAGIELEGSGNNTFILVEGHSTSGRGVYSGSGESTGNLNQHNVFMNVTGNSSSSYAIDTGIGVNQTFIDCYANSSSFPAFGINSDHNNITRCTAVTISGTNAIAFTVGNGNDGNLIASSTAINTGGTNARTIQIGGTNNTLVNIVTYKLGGTGAPLDITGTNNTIINVTTYENASQTSIRMSSADNTSILNSTVHGSIRLDTSSNRNYFYNTFINSSTSVGILLRSAINTTFNDVSVNMTGSGTALLIDTDSNSTVIDGFLLTNNFNITVDSTSNLSGRNVTFFNGNGSLNFPSFTINKTTGFNTNGNLSITFNRTNVSSTRIPQLNVSAKIVLFNISRTLNLSNISPMYDPEDDGVYTTCPATICTEDSYNSTTGDYTFNVTGFTSYSGAETQDTAPPTIAGLVPANNTSRNISTTIEIAANVTDESSINFVRANISQVNGSTVLLTLSQAGGTPIYNNTYTVPNITGLYNTTIIANDSVGNINNQSSQFNGVDQLPPSITNVGCTPSAITTGNSTICNATITDQIVLSAVLANVTLSNGTIETQTVNNNTPNFWVNFSNTQLNGTHNVTWSANDTSNNINNTQTRAILTVNDTYIPSVTALVPANGTLFNLSYTIEIAANVTDNGTISSVQANITQPNGTAVLVTLSQAGGTRIYNSTYTIPPIEGNYNLTIVANDTNGNTNRSQATLFTSNVFCGAAINRTTTLNANMTACTADAIVLNANNIVFNCNGFDITSLGTNSTSAGIRASSRNNVTIQNCNLSWFGNGLFFTSVTNSSITNVNITTNLSRGLDLDSGTDNNTFSNIIARANASNGLEIAGDNNTFINAEGHSTTNIGVRLAAGDNNALSQLTGNSSTSTGIAFVNAINNTVIGCTGNSTSGAGMFFTTDATRNLARTCTVYSVSGATLRFGGSASANLVQDTTTISDTSYAGYLLGATVNNSFSNVTFDARGASASLRIEDSGTRNNTFTNITVFANTGDAIDINAAGNTSISSSRAHANNGRGVYLENGTSGTIISSLFANTTSGTALHINASNNNTIMDVQLNSTTGTPLNISSSSVNTTLGGILFSGNFNAYIDNASSANFSNTTFRNGNGSLRYMDIDVDTTTSLNAGGYISITFNRTSVNQSGAHILSAPATITIIGLSALLNLSNITLLYDPGNGFVGCPTNICTPDSYDSTTRTLVFNVTGFTAYAAVATGPPEEEPTTSPSSSPSGNVPSGEPAPTAPAPASPAPPATAPPAAPTAEAPAVAPAAAPASEAPAISPGAAPGQAVAAALSDARGRTRTTPVQYAYAAQVLSFLHDNKPIFQKGMIIQKPLLWSYYSSTLAFTIKNSANGELHNLELRVGTPDTITLSSITPQSIGTLKPGEEATFDVKIKTGEVTTAQEVIVILESDESYNEYTFYLFPRPASEKPIVRVGRFHFSTQSLFFSFLIGTPLLIILNWIFGQAFNSISNIFTGLLLKRALADEKSLRELLKNNMIRHYRRIYVIPSVYEKYKTAWKNLKPIPLKKIRMREVAELSKQKGISTELATLLTYGRRGFLFSTIQIAKPKIFTVEHLSPYAKEELENQASIHSAHDTIKTAIKVFFRNIHKRLEEIASLFKPKKKEGMLFGTKVEQQCSRFGSLGLVLYDIVKTALWFASTPFQFVYHLVEVLGRTATIATKKLITLFGVPFYKKVEAASKTRQINNSLDKLQQLEKEIDERKKKEELLQKQAQEKAARDRLGMYKPSRPLDSLRQKTIRYLNHHKSDQAFNKSLHELDRLGGTHMPKLQLKTPPSQTEVPQSRQYNDIKKQIDDISNIPQLSPKSIIQKGINYGKQQERRKQAEQRMLNINTRLSGDFRDLEKFINTVERYRKR